MGAATAAVTKEVVADIEEAAIVVALLAEGAVSVVPTAEIAGGPFVLEMFRSVKWSIAANREGVLDPDDFPITAAAI